jgi:hypothetical protein
MPRGFKRAIGATNIAFKNGLFTDKRSFYGFRASEPEKIHQLLFGADKSEQRQKLFDRAKGMCEGCETPHPVDWNHGHWHHFWDSEHPRCDCLHSAMWVCAKFHEGEHVHPRLGTIPGVKGIER